MTNPIQWPSPAKLNLFLHINNKRPDGYHELQTLFQLLDWGDTLSIDVTDTNEINVIGEFEDLPQQDNLIYKAAVALQKAACIDKGANIEAFKRIPTGGGLGGGSSNAATALVALNYQWQCHLPGEELQKIALTLGADVPIFVAGLTSFAEGVGEIISPCPQEQQFFLIVHPNTHVSTAQAFAHPELVRNTPKLDLSQYQFESCRNDFEPVVKSLFTEVANAFDWLVEYAPTRLTGTGACLFACFSELQEANRVLAELPACWRGFVAKGVNESPLITQLNMLRGGQN